MGVAGHGDHPAVGSSSQQAHQPGCEREVPEVVGAELKLEAIRSARRRRHHDARVVDEQV